MTQYTTDQFNYKELTIALRYYLRIPRLIESLEFEAYYYSYNFYASRSFTGTSLSDYNDPSNYQCATSPEYGALKIVSAETALYKRIKHLKSASKKFNKTIAKEDRSKLYSDLKQEELSELVIQFLDFLEIDG